MQSFVAAYQNRNADVYQKLFTADFTFEFSDALDPTLAQKYSFGWFRQDEGIAAANLFDGGVNQDGTFQEGASQIELALGSDLFVDDRDGGRDPRFYKVLSTPVRLRITVPAAGGDIHYAIGEGVLQRHRFFVVRGDHAAALGADQPADSLHWYIWNWGDESLAGKPSTRYSSAATTWGRVKGLYR